MHAESIVFMRRMLEKYSESIRGTILDVGSRNVNGTYRQLIDVKKIEKYIGIDISPGPCVDLVTDDPYRWPIKSATVDVVLCGQTLEHTEFPWMVFAEMVRVTKSGGLILMVHPCAWGMHSYPIDCYRFLPDGYRALVKWAGQCELIEVGINQRGETGDTWGAFRKS